MRVLAALLTLTSAAALTVSNATQNVSNSSVLRMLPPDLEGLYVMEFMSRTDFDGTPLMSLQQQLKEVQDKMFYVFPKHLNNGEPLDSASLCFWFYLKNRRYSDVIWVLTGEEKSDENPSGYVVFSVFSTQLALQTDNCSVRYDYYVERRKWMHICVTMSDALVTYVDGTVIEPVEECTFSGTRDITTENSELFFSSQSGKPISCKVGDARFYLTNITSEDVHAAMTNSRSSAWFMEIIDDIENLPDRPVGVNTKLTPRYELTTSETDNEWVYISAALTSYEAEKVCSKFGGSLLDLSTTTDAEIYIYVINVAMEMISHYWVKPQNESCRAISISVSGVYREPPSNCSFPRRTLCTFPNSTQFSFIGLKYSSTSFRSPMKKVTDFLVWEAEYDHRLEYSETDYVMYLMDPLTWEVFAKTDHVESSNLMGRKTWNYFTTSPASHNLTLTSCNEDQFTCSNGDCIDLQKLCNFETDCADFTDEQLCNYTQKRPSYYDRQLSGQKNLQVNLSLTLLRIHELDMEENTLKVSVRAAARWRDHRVVFHNLHPGIETLIPMKDAKFYWQPNIVMDGVISEDTEALSMDAEPEKMYVIADMPGKAETFGGTEVLEHLGKDVDILHKKEKVVTMTCPLDLFNYPFDVHSCSMTLMLEGNIKSDAEWLPSSEEVLKFSSASLPLFEFVHFKKVPQKGDGNPMLFEIRIARRYGSHLLVTYLPCFIMQLIGLSVFAIPLDDLSNRLTVSISCLIVMAALLTQISSTLPPSADPKMIDVWMFVHTLLLALVFLAMIVINELPGGDDPPQDDTPFWLKGIRLSPRFSRSKAQSARVSPRFSRSKDGKKDKKQKSSLRRTVNKWTAVAFVLSYVVFVIAVMTFTLVIRQAK